MATSTSFGLPSDASRLASLLLLLVAVLAGSFAPGAQAAQTILSIDIQNSLVSDIYVGLLSTSELMGTVVCANPNALTLVEGLSSKTVSVNLQSSTSLMHIVAKVSGDETPLGGRIYRSGGISSSLLTPLIGFKIGGLCGDTSTFGVKFEVTASTNLIMLSECVQPHTHNK